MHTNPVVIFDETQLAEAIYKDVYLRTDRADYVSHVSCVMRGISASTLPVYPAAKTNPVAKTNSAVQIRHRQQKVRETFSPGTKLL
jgi:hypothetical protein